MIITCPGCRTRSRSQPASLGGTGRTVRCSSCSERWFVEPFTAGRHRRPRSAATDARAVQVAAPGRGARAASSPGWLALVVAAGGGGPDRRPQRDRRTPARGRAGLPAAGAVAGAAARHRVPRGPRSEQRVAEGRRVLVVTGEISNISGQAARMSRRSAWRCSTRSGASSISACSIRPQPALGPGGASRFEVELGAPPPEASDFSVSFGEMR